MSPAGILRCACGARIELDKDEFLELKQEQILDSLLDRHAAHVTARKQKGE